MATLGEVSSRSTRLRNPFERPVVSASWLSERPCAGAGGAQARADRRRAGRRHRDGSRACGSFVARTRLTRFGRGRTVCEHVAYRVSKVVKYATPAEAGSPRRQSASAASRRADPSTRASCRGSPASRPSRGCRGSTRSERADIAVVGVPFDSGVSYRPGARFGPAHVREASRLLRPYNPAQDVFPFGAQQVADAGDIAANPFDIAAAVAEIEAGAPRAARARRPARRHRRRPHDRAAAAARGRAEHGPVAVLHFDAHLDTWDTYFGAPDHARHPVPPRVGGGADRPHREHARRHPRAALRQERPRGRRAPRLRDRRRASSSRSTACAAAVERIRSRVGDKPLYISIDIDVLDPAHAPGTGTPEAGGLTSRELLRMLRALTDLRIVGADVVEVAPAYDHAQLTAVAASHVVYELLSAMAPR